MSDLKPRHSLLAECCSAFGSTRPAALPATRPWHTAADRVLAASRPQLVPLLIVLGVLATLSSRALPLPVGMLPIGAFFLIAGGWCTLNLARSGEAHCVVFGVGWNTLALLTLIAIALDVDWRSPLWLAFFAILLAGTAFELGWAKLKGSTSVFGRS